MYYFLAFLCTCGTVSYTHLDVYKRQFVHYLFQPCDYGKLIYLKDGVSYEVPVIQVTRRKDKAVHFVETPLPEGQVVKQVLDWERRHDHMQQHSGRNKLYKL